MSATDEELLQKLQYEINFHQPVPLERRTELAKLFGTTPEHILELINQVRFNDRQDEKKAQSLEANQSCFRTIGLIVILIVGAYLFIKGDENSTVQMTNDPTSKEVYDGLSDEGKAEVQARMREYDRVCAKRADC